MNHQEITEKLRQILLERSNLSDENSEETESYIYIVTISMSIKLSALQLKDKLKVQIQNDKEEQLKYRQLFNSLENIVRKFDFKIKVENDKEHIEYIFQCIKNAEKEFAVLKLYLQKISTTSHSSGRE